MTPGRYRAQARGSRSSSRKSPQRALRRLSVATEDGASEVIVFATRFWGELVGQPGGSGGIDDAFAQQHGPGIGAEIMGAGKFGPPGWHQDPEWKGWWGPNPPFHTPTSVLTHHPRPSTQMEGGTTFHFIDASPAEALEGARKAADGRDIRLGGPAESRT